jgi:hypothetical protein
LARLIARRLVISASARAIKTLLSRRKMQQGKTDYGQYGRTQHNSLHDDLPSTNPVSLEEPDLQAAVSWAHARIHAISVRIRASLIARAVIRRAIGMTLNISLIAGMEAGLLESSPR